jgi:hypothetical protein
MIILDLPDFQSYVIPGQYAFGAKQTLWMFSESGNIAGGAAANYNSLTVAVGYRLFICGGMISNLGSQFSVFELVGAVSLTGRVAYDVNCEIPMSLFGPYPFENGESFHVTHYNYDNVAQGYTSLLYGYYEEV